LKHFKQNNTFSNDSNSAVSAEKKSNIEDEFEEPLRKKNIKGETINLIDNDDGVNSREACLHSDRYSYQYFLFFCLCLFQCATAFFYVRKF
jgi:hypothetical protein